MHKEGHPHIPGYNFSARVGFGKSTAPARMIRDKVIGVDSQDVVNPSDQKLSSKKTKFTIARTKTEVKGRGRKTIKLE